MILTEFNDEMYREMVFNEIHEDVEKETNLDNAKTMKYMLNDDGTRKFKDEDILMVTGISKKELEQL